MIDRATIRPSEAREALAKHVNKDAVSDRLELEREIQRLVTTYNGSHNDEVVAAVLPISGIKGLAEKLARLTGEKK